MIRAIFNNTELLVVIEDVPNTGITQTLNKVLIDTPQGVADKLLDQGINIQLLIDSNYISIPDSIYTSSISDHPESSEEAQLTRQVDVCRFAMKLEQSKIIFSCFVKTFDQYQNLDENHSAYFKSFTLSGTDFNDFMSSISNYTLESCIISKISDLDQLGFFNN